MTLPCARAARRPEARRFGIQLSLILNRERRPVASGRRLLAKAMVFLPSRDARQCLARLSTSAAMSYFYIEGIQPRGTGCRVVSVCHGTPRPWRWLGQRVQDECSASPCVNARKTSRLPRNQPDSRLLLYRYICNRHRYHSRFVRVPNNGTEVAASSCEIARDLCDRMCLNIFK